MLITDFKITEDTLQSQNIWWGEYRGVHFTVKCTPHKQTSSFDLLEKATWTFYLNLMKEQFDPTIWKKICPNPNKKQYMPNGRIYADYNYYHIPIISNLKWHGEITYFERHFDQFGKVSAIEAGCDYAHAFDMNYEYDLRYVLYDVKECIDSLCDSYDLKVHCSTVGGYYPLSEGAWTTKGTFISNKGQEWRTEQGWPPLELLDSENVICVEGQDVENALPAKCEEIKNEM